MFWKIEKIASKFTCNVETGNGSVEEDHGDIIVV